MPLGDYFGRRLVLVGTLAVFVSANAGLLYSNSFLSLMLLRAAQAFGSADLPVIGEITLFLGYNKLQCSNLSSGAAVIGDISTGEERGALIGTYGSGELNIAVVI